MSYTTFSTVQDGAILRVTFDNGDVNIMTATMAAELFALVGQLAVDTETKVVVFDSANRDFFIAHFDIEDVVKVVENDPSVPTSKVEGINVLQALGLSLGNLSQVTMAKVDGICRGGGFEFMLSLDMCFATEGAVFCFPEANAGFLPAGGGSTFLPVRAGSGRALEIMLTGRDFSGAEAAQYNVVNRAFADSAQLDEYVDDVAGRIAANSAAANRAVKSVISQTFSGMNDGVFAGLAQENVAMTECVSSPEVLRKLKWLAANSGQREQELDLPATIASYEP